MSAQPEDAASAAGSPERRLPWETPAMTIDSVADVTEGGGFYSGTVENTFYTAPTS